MTDWQIFRKGGKPEDNRILNLPAPPTWRQFQAEGQDASRTHRGKTFQARPEVFEAVNAALYLRRPLLVTGSPGTGKTSLAYAVAYQLGLGEVLEWSIKTRTVLNDGLYRYDAIGRAQEQGVGSLENIGKYIQLGPMGTALFPFEGYDRPRVLLIDEIDKSDIDLPNDLLNIFEEGRFEIPELGRIYDKDNPKTHSIGIKTAFQDKSSPAIAEVPKGVVRCREHFPLVIMTSNGERQFPAPFLRRCLRLTMEKPQEVQLKEIVRQHIQDKNIDLQQIDALVATFLRQRDQNQKELATDQLLNAVYLMTRHQLNGCESKDSLVEMLLKALDEQD